MGIKVKKLKELIQKDPQIKATIIDIREKEELKTCGKIIGSTHVPMNKLLQNPSKYLKKNKKYYIMCASGARSSSTTLMLWIKRYKVSNVSGGYNKYKLIDKL